MILICGASGLVGRELCALLDEFNIKFIGTYNSNKIDKENYYKLDFHNKEGLYEFMKHHKITNVVSCVVERFTDICEKNWDLTKKTNVDIVHNISEICKTLDIFFFHISTDYIFDGQSPPYNFNSNPNPLQNYGISKLIAEYRVKASGCNYCILRVPVLYSTCIKNLEDSAVTCPGKKVLDMTTTHKEDNMCIRRPVFIPDMCNFIIHCIQNNLHGTYNFYNPYNITTKYDICTRVANYLNKTYNHISPINEYPKTGIMRPIDTQLIDTQYDIFRFYHSPINTVLGCFEKLYHPKNFNDTFLMLDMDGTITDTDDLHYNCYRKALADYGYEPDIILTEEKFIELTETNSVTQYLKELVGNKYDDIKKSKYEYVLKSTNINLIDGFKKMIDLIEKNNLNYAIVTNTNRLSVNHFRSINKDLNRLTNWITREDYDKPKPDREPYDTAIKRYYKDEKYMVGFENTIGGYNSLSQITKCIYFVTKNGTFSYNRMKKEDVYLIDSYSKFL